MTAQLWQPAATYLGEHVPGTEEWANARAGRLGGSEIAAVLGLSPFESRFSLWHRKRGVVGGVEDSSEMEWGRRLEDAVAQKFADDHPEFQVRAGGAWQSAEHDWMIAHPDRLLYPVDPSEPVEVLEVKTSPYGDGWGQAGTDDIPVYYRTQAFHYLDCLGLRRCRVIVLIGGVDYREYVVDLDDNEQASIRRMCTAFLATVAADERPDVDEHSQTYQVIRELHPDIDPERIELAEPTALRYLEACAAEKRAKTEKQYATSLVADEMGRAQRALHDGAVVAIRMAKQGGLPFVKAAPRKDT